MEDVQTLDFLNEKNSSDSLIKVFGIGGGGGNAVNHMYNEGIKDVGFVICNTDKQALENSPIRLKVLLGPDTCSGLGAGADPQIACDAAKESENEIRSILENGTRMVFIAATMGGGTGTGASPYIAKIAKEMGILTVGIVTIPFLFEGKQKIRKAFDGVRQLKENVDALLVINNERIKDIYPMLSITKAFALSDDVLKDAAKSIAEIITVHGKMNIDFQDVNTTMRNGGVAIMNTGYASGENRMEEVLKNAMESPLLRDSDIKGAKHILLNFHCRSNEEDAFQMDEFNYVNKFSEEMYAEDTEVIWGYTFDDNLEPGQIRLTLIATGFGIEDIDILSEKQSDKKVDTPNKLTKEEIEKKEFEKNYGDTKIEQERKEVANKEELGKTTDSESVERLSETPAIDRVPTIGVKKFKPKGIK